MRAAGAKVAGSSLVEIERTSAQIAKEGSSFIEGDGSTKNHSAIELRPKVVKDIDWRPSEKAGEQRRVSPNSGPREITNKS